MLWKTLFEKPTGTNFIMSKAFIAAVLQDSVGCTGVAAGQAANDLIAAIVEQISVEGFFTLPSFGAFTKKVAKGGQRMNPRTGEKVMVEDHFTVRFKASPVLKKLLATGKSGSPVKAQKTASVVQPVKKQTRQVKKVVAVVPEVSPEKTRRGRKKMEVPAVVEDVPVVVAPVRRKPGPKPGSKRVTKTKARSGQ